MESSYLAEGPFRPAPFPPGSNQYPPPEHRLVANLALVAVPPITSKDDLRPSVPFWYFTVVASDDVMEQRLLQQGMSEAEIAPRAALFSLLGPDPFGLAKAAHHLALSLGWQPRGASPRHGASPEGAGFRPWVETMNRPRPPKPLPMEMVLQHAMTIRTKLFAGKEIPGWLFAWDAQGTPHKTCGFVYGMQGMTNGAPCGRTEGCTLRGGGACVWAEQALTDAARNRGPVSVVPDVAPTEPLPHVPPVPVYVPGIRERHPGMSPAAGYAPPGMAGYAPPAGPANGAGFHWQAAPGVASGPPPAPPGWATMGPTAWGGPGTPLPPQIPTTALPPPAPVSAGWPMPPGAQQPVQSAAQPVQPAAQPVPQPAPPAAASPQQPPAPASEWPSPPTLPPALDFA